MDIFEELSRKLTMIEARIASYERLHTEELAELKTMLQSLKMQQVSLRSEAAREAAKRLKSETASETAARKGDATSQKRDDSD